MERYVKQLVEDLLSAQRDTSKIPPYQEIESFETHIAEVERYLSGANEQLLSKLWVLKRRASRQQAE